MKRVHAVGAAILAVALAAGRLSGQAPSQADSSFRAFLPSFEAGLLDLLNGDTTLWFANASHAHDVTLFPPFGNLVQGWDNVAARYRFAASQMVRGTSMQVQYVTIAAQGDIAYTVSVERSHHGVPGDATYAVGETRVTHAFRREGGAWKMVHRHMDHLPMDGKPPS